MNNKPDCDSCFHNTKVRCLRNKKYYHNKTSTCDGFLMSTTSTKTDSKENEDRFAFKDKPKYFRNQHVWAFIHPRLP